MTDPVLEWLRLLIVQTTRFVSPPPVALEWALVALVALAAALAPRWAERPLRALRDRVRRVGRSTRLAILLCGLLPVAARLCLLGVVPPPDPSIHDEFSHLLLGDTLAHGRATNPTHPMWRHFETIHVIQQPTYNSMYPPAQGAFLAAGQAVFGSPWAGVALAMGLAGAAVCWMMQGWLPRAWAFYGALLMAVKIGVASLWINSYLAAAVPTLGGALLLGALPRMRRPVSRASDAWAAGLGIVILMHSRPFEGAVLSAAGMVYLLPEVRRGIAKHWGHYCRVAAGPLAISVACGAVLTGVYCWKVTGSPLRMPYQVNRDAYGWPENLAFLPAKSVELKDQALADMYAKEVRHREIYKSPQRLLENLATRVFESWTCLIGPLLTLPLLGALLYPNRRRRALTLILAAMAALNLLQMVLYPYHLAPVVPLLFVLVAEGARRICVTASRTSRRRGLVLAAALPAALAASSAMKLAADELRLPLAYWERSAEPHREERASIVAWLKEREKKQLVVVRYASGHPPDQEWVYNGADIDGGKIVWAREVDAESDARLLQYFPDREAWLLEADRHPRSLLRYGRAPQPVCAGGGWRAP